MQSACYAYPNTLSLQRIQLFRHSYFGFKGDNRNRVKMDRIDKAEYCYANWVRYVALDLRYDYTSKAFLRVCLRLLYTMTCTGK